MCNFYTKKCNFYTKKVQYLQQKNCHFYKFDCTNNTLFGMYFMQVVKKCNDYTGRAVEKKGQ